MRSGRRRNPGRFWAVAYAVLIHVGVVAALVIGFRWTDSAESTVPGNTIQAVVAEDPARLEAERKRAEEQRRLEEERRQAERERLEEERRQAEAERQRQEEEARKREEEARRQAEEQRRLEEERRQAELERQRLEEERRQAEAERQRQEEEARRRAEAEDALRRQLAEEEQARAEAQRRASATEKMGEYTELIRQHVSRRWNPPLNTPSSLTCLVRVRFIPGTWEVLEATVVRSSGNRAFDDSVERAVLAASPLPLPPDRELFEYYGELNFEFDPAR